jgi:hypothetical protein
MSIWTRSSPFILPTNLITYAFYSKEFTNFLILYYIQLCIFSFFFSLASLPFLLYSSLHLLHSSSLLPKISHLFTISWNGTHFNPLLTGKLTCLWNLISYNQLWFNFFLVDYKNPPFKKTCIISNGFVIKHSFHLLLAHIPYFLIFDLWSQKNVEHTSWRCSVILCQY